MDVRSGLLVGHLLGACPGLFQSNEDSDHGKTCICLHFGDEWKI